MESYSLKEVNQYIKQVISLNFEDSLWIDAEISQVKEVRGQMYLELIDKHEGVEEVNAKAQAVIWYKSLLFIKRKLGELTSSILEAGRQVRIKAKVDFHEIYGLKLDIEDIDLSFSIGMAELNRQKTIEKLKKENLLYKNQETELPPIIKNIAIISSSKAAGLQDFVQHLHNNAYQYSFDTVLFESGMQGRTVERELISNIDKILESETEFDCIVIIRGGGSKMDLSYFDNYNICVKVANCPIPVITGIGHDIDQNLIELVAHSPMKTPTAVADFIVTNNALFENSLLELQKLVQNKANEAIGQQKISLENIEQRIKNSASMNLLKKHQEVDNIKSRIDSSLAQLFIVENNKIAQIEEKIKLLNPQNILRKGYSVTTKNGKIIKSIENIKKGETVTTLLPDGKFDSRVI